MPAIRHLLERWGFVKLSRYGLELTPDGRIVSQRPVLDDGTGARIVGWREGDVAIWKLANRADSVRIPRQALPAPSRQDPEDHGPASRAASEGSSKSGAMTTSRSTASRALPGVAAVASAAPARVTRPSLAGSVSSPAVAAWSADEDEIAASAPDAAAARVVGGGAPAAMAPAPLATPAATAASAPASRSLAVAQLSEIVGAPTAISTTAPLPVVASRKSAGRPAAALEATAAAAATPNAPPAAAAAVSASPARTSAIIPPAEVASPAPVDEDDWEWTIALARARVAVEEAHSVRRTTPSSSPAVPVPGDRPTSRPAVVREPTMTGDWPATAPIGSIDYDDYRVATRPAIPLPSVHGAGVRPAPTTVIPVPPLPTLETTMHVRLEPVVRTSHAPPPAARLAKGTGPLDPEQGPAQAASRRHAAMLIDEASANLSVGDRTRPGVAVAAAAQARRAATTLGTAAPVTNDPTKPGIALPPVARAVALPSIKRRTAPR